MSMKFSDSEGREWYLRFDIAASIRLREQHDIRLTDPSSLSQLCASEELQYVAASVALDAQIKEIGQAKFAEVFTKNYVKFAGAIASALENFYHCLGRRDLESIVKSAFENSKKVVSSIADQMNSDLAQRVNEASIQSIKKEIQKELEETLKNFSQINGNTSGESSESSGSTQDPSPSETSK